ncbi:MAG: VOC family protein [Bacteroidota bacterium]
MKIKDSYPVFVTKELNATKDYYVNALQFNVFFESSWFLLLQTESENPYFIAFMDEQHPTSPPSIPAINSKSGVFLTLEVDDAKAEYEKLTAAGLEIYYHLKEEAWGQKRFGLIDPNGMYIDIVEQIAPEEGYWDQYMTNSL